MKKFLFSCLSFFASGLLFSQISFNKAYHEIHEKPNPFAVSIYGDVYFTSKLYDASDNLSSYGRNYIYKHNGLGNLVFRLYPLPYSFTQGFESKDHKLVLAGRDIVCDAPGPFQTNVLARLDTAGAVAFAATYTVQNGDVPKAVLQYADSSYYSFTDSLLFKHSKTGQFISETHLPGITSVSSALLLQNNNILLSAKLGGVNSLLVLSAASQTVMSSATPVLFNKLSFYGGQKIVGLGTDNKFYKYSAGLNLIYTTVNPQSIVFSDFVCSADTIYTLYKIPSAQEFYHVVDTAFSPIANAAIATHSLSQDAICLSGDRAVVLSTGKSCPSVSGPFGAIEHYFASLNVFKKLSYADFSSDLAVTSVVKDTAYVNCSPITTNPGANSCYSYFRGKVTVKNAGATVITSFKLNCFEELSIACGNFFYQQKFSGLSLAPGASTTITSGLIERYHSYVTNDSVSDVFCLYITLPNGETDKTVEDNQLCYSGNSHVTALREYSKNNITVSVSPNPFENNLLVSSEAMITSLELINSMGMVIRSGAANSRQVAIDDVELPAGIYFVKLDTEKGPVIKKVIRE